MTTKISVICLTVIDGTENQTNGQLVQFFIHILFSTSTKFCYYYPPTILQTRLNYYIKFLFVQKYGLFVLHSMVFVHKMRDIRRVWSLIVNECTFFLVHLMRKTKGKLYIFHRDVLYKNILISGDEEEKTAGIIGGSWIPALYGPWRRIREGRSKEKYVPLSFQSWVKFMMLALWMEKTLRNSQLKLGTTLMRWYH